VARRHRTLAVAPACRPETHLILTDLHVPFHHKALLPKVVRLIADLRPDGLVLGGDFLDVFSLSKHVADSVYFLRDVTLEGEYAEGTKVLDAICAAMPAGARLEYLYGNHEDRYFRELQKGDRGKYGGALQSPTEALRLRERGFTVGEKWDDDAVRLGDHLEVVHGIYCSKHAACKHVEEFQGSVAFGHTHRMQSFYLGKRAGFNLGGLFDADHKAFGYMARVQRLKWSNGFGIARIDDAGDFNMEVVQAWNGSFTAAGRTY